MFQLILKKVFICIQKLYNCLILDIDECSRTSGICSNGVCENMMGTYQCVCDDGYQQTGLKLHCEGKAKISMISHVT